jgi:tripartite-type tricarboxylate transporter receptor subunit TctC
MFVLFLFGARRELWASRALNEQSATIALVRGKTRVQMKKLLLLLTTSTVIAAAGTSTWAQSPPAVAPDYPAKTVRLIVPFPPGGGTDAVARITAQKLSEGFGQQFIVDNRPGANGLVGTDAIAKASPDGYTLGMMISSFAVNPGIYDKLPYDPLKDFTPITLIVRGLYVVVVHPSVQAMTIKELIALAKSSPGKLNAPISGIGSPSHLGLELFKKLAGVEIVGINYKGAGPAVIDLLSGQGQVMFVSMPSVQQHIQSGKLRALATGGTKRSPAAPELPTVAEAGVPGYEVSEW